MSSDDLPPVHTLVDALDDEDLAALPPSTVLLVSGMHRSGTSAVAQLLAANGAHAGPDDRLIGRQEHNRRGHVEDRPATHFDQRLLEELEGTWWSPPSRRALQRARAEHVQAARPVWEDLRAVIGAAPALFKDPRLSLLLPVWREVVGPDVLHVVCLRDPLAVARSLQRRNGMELHPGLALWETYVTAGLAGLSGALALFVDADRLVADLTAREELVRVVRRRCGLPERPLADTLEPALLSPPSTEQELREHLTSGQLGLYRSVRRLAGLGVVRVRDLSGLEPSAAASQTLLRNRRITAEVDRLRRASVPGEATTTTGVPPEVEARLVAQAERLSRLDAALAEAQVRVTGLELELAAATAARRAAEARAVEMEASASAAHQTLAEAFSSRSWRWTRVLRREPRAPRPARRALPGPSSAPQLVAASVPRVAVVAHVFYPELWQPLRQQLANLQEPYDLYVSLTEGVSDGLVDQVRADEPGVTVRVDPNRGRDIAPFCRWLASGDLDEYPVLLKIHTKRSHHRVDGDEWRTALWHGLLPSPRDAHRFVDVLVGNPDVGCIVPEGNVLTADSLGSNEPAVRALLQRVGLDYRDEDLAFPAGSMYWLDGSVVQLLKALRLDPDADFPEEQGQIDGTTAHAFERVLGVVLKRRGQVVLGAQAARRTEACPDWTQRRRPRVLAFYLPQYHRTAENDAWWGDGFTDWDNVDAARPWHEHQDLPRRPAAPLGRYDLTDVDVLQRQARLAAAHGIDGFLVYHYWFSGRRLLQGPLDRLLAAPQVEFPHALVWANESWTRTWDGLDDDVLVAQEYERDWVDGLFASLLPHLRDPRYLRVDERLMLTVFKPGLVPALGEAAARLRQLARDAGLGELHLAGVLHDRHAAADSAACSPYLDSWIEFPPLSGPTPREVAKEVHGTVYDYPSLVTDRRHVPVLDGRRVHPGAMPSWDNTPRRREQGASSFAHANPADFRRWMVELRRAVAGTSLPGEAVVCVNAWNEWAETAYLEPDERSGLAALEAVRSAFGPCAVDR